MKNNSTRGGSGISGLLGIVFIVLKLCGVIQWGWIWVLAPFWISFLFWVIVLTVIEVIKRALDQEE